MSKGQIAGGGEATDVMCRSLLGLADHAITAIWLVDPKKKEFGWFSGSPSLLCRPILLMQFSKCYYSTVKGTKKKHAVKENTSISKLLLILLVIRMWICRIFSSHGNRHAFIEGVHYRTK